MLTSYIPPQQGNIIALFNMGLSEVGGYLQIAVYQPLDLEVPYFQSIPYPKHKIHILYKPQKVVDILISHLLTSILMING